MIILLRKAISQTYNEISDSDKLIECVSLIDDIEERIIDKYSNKLDPCKYRVLLLTFSDLSANHVIPRHITGEGGCLNEYDR